MDAAVEQDTVALVAIKVSLNSEFISRKNCESKYLKAGLQKYETQCKFSDMASGPVYKNWKVT